MFNYLNKRRKKGQSTLEYAILIVVVIGALLSIQVYVKRGVQGRFKEATDDIGKQFDPGNTNGVIIKTTKGATRDTNKAGNVASTLTADEVQTEVMNYRIQNVQQTFWGT